MVTNYALFKGKTTVTYVFTGLPSAPLIGILYFEDWTGLVKRGLVKRGLIKRGLVKRGLVKRGLVKRGLVKRGLVKRGLVKRGLVKRGLVKRGLVKRGLRIGSCERLFFFFRFFPRL